MKVQVLIVVAAGLLTAADTPKGEETKEIPKFQGAWQAVAAERGGVPYTEEKVRRVRWTVEGDKISGTNIDNIPFQATYRLDPTRSPKTIDFTDPTMLSIGIYDFHGDRLKVCMTTRDRPTDFVTKGKEDRTLFVFKRVAKASRVGKGDGARTDREKLQGTWTVSGFGGKAAKWVIKGDQITMTHEGETITLAYQLDPAQKPKAIDLTFTGAEMKGELWKGIYVLSDDEVQLLFNEKDPTTARPAEVPKGRNPDLARFVLKRQKP